jgi:hypothetical protein
MSREDMNWLSEPPAVFQSPPCPSDDDIEFASDMAYLRNLANAVMVDLHAGAHGRLAEGFLRGGRR